MLLLGLLEGERLAPFGETDLDFDLLLGRDTDLDLDRDLLTEGGDRVLRGVPVLDLRGEADLDLRGEADLDLLPRLLLRDREYLLPRDLE